MSENKNLSAKAYLGQLQELDTFINQDIERLSDMKLGATSTGAIRYDKERVQTSPQNTLERQVCNYVTYEEMLNAKIDAFVDAKETIIEQIRGLHQNNYIQVLYKVYVQFKSLRTAAKEMKVSYSYVIELHQKALSCFEETYTNLSYLT